MKKTKSMRLAVLAAGLLCCSIFTVPAYAQSSEPQEETPPAQEAPQRPKPSRKHRTRSALTAPGLW